jgi:hypothetical protein
LRGEIAPVGSKPAILEKRVDIVMRSLPANIDLHELIEPDPVLHRS